MISKRPTRNALRGERVNNGENGRSGTRPARMPIHSTVLLSRGGDSWTTDIEDISASGALVRKPTGWSGRVGDTFVLDMMIGEDLHIHLEATVARETAEYLGFAYSRIPDDKEIPLWNLLGGYADRLENY